MESETTTGEKSETGDGASRSNKGKLKKVALPLRRFRPHGRRAATFAIALAVVAVGAAGAFAADQVPFADQIPLVGSIDTAQEATHLSSIHAAKGREFRAVFLPALEESELPHYRALAGRVAAPR